MKTVSFLIAFLFSAGVWAFTGPLVGEYKINSNKIIVTRHSKKQYRVKIVAVGTRTVDKSASLPVSPEALNSIAYEPAIYEFDGLTTGIKGQTLTVREAQFDEESQFADWKNPGCVLELTVVFGSAFVAIGRDCEIDLSLASGAKTSTKVRIQ